MCQLSAPTPDIPYQISNYFHRPIFSGTLKYILNTLLKKLKSKVDGFTVPHFYLKVITSDVKVGCKQEKSSSEGITF